MLNEAIYLPAPSLMWTFMAWYDFEAPTQMQSLPIRWFYSLIFLLLLFILFMSKRHFIFLQAAKDLRAAIIYATTFYNNFTVISSNMEHVAKAFINGLTIAMYLYYAWFYVHLPNTYICYWRNVKIDKTLRKI